ncbi:hypothetical protein KL86PLE_40555 [uncultured Pleomorphomonas sp.]|uniref:Uncharacterized protein n=1 Tax=uncultured Pleomorphomonas sp. TaxID=442121 RepID=A0A212LGY1_9HYPH|nr:hypothetical protein KL86PLE_40555 [uncultured Pleomorphomonas sp.]
MAKVNTVQTGLFSLLLPHYSSLTELGLILRKSSLAEIGQCRLQKSSGGRAGERLQP